MIRTRRPREGSAPGPRRGSARSAATCVLGLALALSTAAGLAACGDPATGPDGPPIDVSLDEAAFADADWEREFAADEFTVWHTGEILAVPAGPMPDLASLERLEGATVELILPRPDGLPPFQVVDTVRSAEGGRFRVGPAPAGSWLLRVTQDGFATGFGGNAPRIFGSMFLPDGDALFGIRRGVPIAVTVRDESGAPLPGARVRAQTMAFHQDSEADSDGVAQFFVPPGPLEVVTLADDRAGARASIDAAPAGDLPTEDVQAFELVAPTVEPLTGWVRDAETGRPLSGAVVLSVERPELRTLTDERGRFTLQVARRGLVAAFGAGRGWQSHEVPPAGELELRLGPAQHVTGTVTGPDGEPVVGARALASAPSPAGVALRVLGPITGADGGFSFDWCPEPPRGSEEQAVVVAYRRGLAWSDGVRLADPGRPLAFRLGALRRVEGAILRDSGVSSPGVMVELEIEPTGLEKHEAVAVERPFSFSVRTGPEGEFAFAGVPRTEALIRYRVDGARIERTVEAGEDARADLRLDGGRAIAGRVVDVAGDAVTRGGSVVVSALNHPEFSELLRSVPLGDDGTFRIGDLPEGTFGVRASVSGYDVGGTVVDAGAMDVVLIAERPVELTFELEFPDGSEPPPVLVQLQDADDPSARPRRVLVEPGDDGARGTIELVRRGRYHVLARGGAFRAHLRDVEIPDGERPPMHVVMELTLVRTLRLQDRDGSPLSGRRVRVVCVSERGRPVETYFTGENGEAEISGLSVGEWLARVVEPGKPTLESRFRVEGGGGDDVLMRHSAYGAIIVRPDREALGGEEAIISLLSSDGATLYGWTEKGGELAARFRTPAEGDLIVRGLPAGDAELVVQVGAGKPRRVPVRIEDGGEVTVRIP